MKRLLILITILGLLAFLSMCSGEKNNSSSDSAGGATTETTTNKTPFKPYEITDSSKIDTLPSGLMIYIVEKGSGKIPQAGETVIANYHGMLPDGTVFDSSFERGQPFVFQVGVGQVIKGWDEAFQKLPVGTKAVLIIPPQLGYGERQMGPIPPNSTLIFDVEVLGVSQ